MEHRFDGKLVALGMFDLTRKYLLSSQFVHDPAYRSLNLGTVSAVKEVEFMHHLRETYGMVDLRYYSLSELVLTCAKVNYKLHYYPGEVFP